MKFIYAYDNETKEKLMGNNYKLMTTQILNDKKVFVFLNNGKKLNFDNMNINLTNKFMFQDVI